MSITYCGSDPSRSMKARTTPGTPEISARMRRASSWMRSRSSPRTLITICPSTWEMLSSTLSRIGWSNDGSMPGSSDTAASISRIRSSLVLPGRQRDSGTKSTKSSVELRILGSVPSSGRPAFAITVFTSGTVCSARRTAAICTRVSSGDTDGGRNRFTHVVPSFSSGRNSLPRRVAPARDTASITAATNATVHGRTIALRSSGS